MLTPTIIDFPYRPDAEPLFEAIRHLPGALWLDSGKPRSLQGRFDILTAAPRWRLAEWHSTSPFLTQAQEMLDELGTLGGEYSHYPFIGGLAGFFGYDLGQTWIATPGNPPAAIDLPDIHLGCYTWALVLNHPSRKGWLLFHPACPPAQRTDIEKRLQATPASVPESEFRLTSGFKGDMSHTVYMKAVARIQNYITAGDCYQVNLAQHFSAAFQGDTWRAYRALRRVLPSPYSAYMAWDDKAVLSLSPERFLKVSVGQVESKPIKGTLPRGQTLAEDGDNAIRLMNSTKDRAENLMIVDLLRNDLGKVCRPGSIRVPKLFALETFANVHHLVSTVTGTLADNETPLSLLAACFPGGSITGAPKKRAMEIIAELEPCRRGLYCGSIGYISATGRMDTNIAIRTLLADKGRIHCWGGGGIVADSNPEAEYGESLNKIRVLMHTLETL